MHREGIALDIEGRNVAVRRDIRVADVVQLPGVNVEVAGSKKRIAPGRALRVSASQQLLQVSRRDGGLPHRFAVFEGGCDAMIGGIFVKSDDALHVVFLDLGAPEVQALLGEAERTQCFRVLFVSATGDMRLMIPSFGDGLQMLVKATRKARALDIDTYVTGMTEALNTTLSSQTLSILELDVSKLQSVELSYVVTSSTAASMERKLKSGLTLH